MITAPTGRRATGMLCIMARTAMRDANAQGTPCDEGFAMGGGASFARCCCQ